MLRANWTLYPVTDPAAEGEGNPFGVFIDESAPLVAGINDVCGCLVIWTGADAETEAAQFKTAVEARGFTAPVFSGDGKTAAPMTGTTTFPMALSHAFVFGDAGTADTVSRFAAGLNSCVQLYATTEVDLNPDEFRTLMAASPCCAARAERFRVKVADSDASVLGASGTCNTATSGRRMFMAKLHPGTAEITFPADCISNVRYLLVSGRDPSQWPSDADAPLVVVQGAYETLGKSSCTVGGLGSRLFTAESDLEPMPHVVINSTGTNFPFAGTLVQHDGNLLTTPTETEPCWIDVRQDGAGAGRRPVPDPGALFEPDSDSVRALYDDDGRCFSVEHQLRLLYRGRKPATDCAAPDQSVELAGAESSDWNNPTLGRWTPPTGRSLPRRRSRRATRDGPEAAAAAARSEPPTVAWARRARSPCTARRSRPSRRQILRPISDAHRVRAVSVDVNQPHEAPGLDGTDVSRSGSTATCRRASRWPRRSSTRTPARL